MSPIIDPQPQSAGGLSAAEVAAAAALLARLDPGVLPYELFHQVMRLTVASIIEVVPLRTSPAGETQVLLLSRAADDPIWPAQLHVPGTVLRPSDQPGKLGDALARIATELELAGLPDPTFVTNIFHNSGRGMEASQVFWVDTTNSLVIGDYYDIHQLPDSLVKSQLDFLPAVFENYKSHHYQRE